MGNVKLASIVFQPTCSACGMVLYGSDIHVSGELLQRVEPSDCPYCGAHFDTVQMPTGLPYEAEFPEFIRRS